MSIESLLSRGAPAANPDEGPPSLRSFLDSLLDEQQRLQTPVARFSATHLQGGTPALEPIYRDLIPLSVPRPGEQYAFEVDLDSCTGCKACVAGCHSLNGLDDTETWRDVGLLLGTENGRPVQQTVTTACHHCADPACLNGCPVLAYEKDPITGIVRHLDDQCIGCQYCVLKCPYDVPKYSQRLGIVRKCDLCHDRLAEGEAPACVQACPTQAIRVVTVQTYISPSRAQADTSRFLSGAPDPAYTKPTTRYVSSRTASADLQAADADTLRVQPAHFPLVLMLVLTQVAVGLTGASLLEPPTAGMSPTDIWSLVGLASLSVGLLASVAHLGQPLRAWRVFLNLRRSWLSREAVVFGSQFPIAAASVCSRFDLIFPLDAAFAMGLSATALGLAGVACSAMIYIDTRRTSWGGTATHVRFFGTLVIAGLVPLLPAVAAVALLGKLAVEATARFTPDSYQPGRLDSSARVLRGPLGPVLLARFGVGLVTISLLFFGFVAAGFTLFVAGEFLERTLFFRSVSVSKMPGVPHA